MQTSKPNILFIMADQLSASVLPTYGHETVQTPNLERLADKGVVFDNCYCNFPLCAPSRASFMTGQLASKIGAYDNATELPAAIPTFVHYMRKMGYQTVLSGKMHFVGPDQLHGFEERLTTEIYPSNFIWTPDWDSDLTFQDMRSVREAGICQRSMQLDYDEEVAYKAIQKLYDFAREPDQKPFFLCVSFTHPHDPYVTTPVYWNRYDHGDIDMPSIGKIAQDELDSFSKRLLHHYGIEKEPVSDAQIRNARHAYYGSVSYIDDKVGALMDVLEKTKFCDNTIVIFTTDHGDMLGERGMWYKKAFFDWSAKVPLFFYAPKIFQSRRVDAVTSLVDLFPTIVELAQGKQSDIVGPIDGNSLCDFLRGDEAQWSGTAYSEMLAEGVDAPYIMIRRGRYKFIYCPGDSPVIFNMVEDPAELKNLAGSSDVAEIEAAFVQEVESKWDIAELTKCIITSQKQRRLILEAMLNGESSSWDYQPGYDASKRFIRTSERWTDIEARYLLPWSTE